VILRGGATAAALAAHALLSVGAAAAPPAARLGLSVWPARLSAVGGRPQQIHVRNGGGRPVVVDVSPAGFGLDLRGTPRVVRAAGAARWLVLRPRTLRLAAGATRTLTAWPAVPHGARPGDHPALVLLRTRPAAGRAIGVEVRVGVVVDVRVAGAARRTVVLHGLRVVRGRHRRSLLLSVENAGDVTERVGRTASLTLYKGKTLVARLRPHGRELLPRSRGLVEFVYTGPRRGPVRAFVSVVDAPLEAFHVRL
jgi:hypothetical protein